MINGDCLAVMSQYDDNHFSGIITDPPYGIKFMGKKWDSQIPGKEYWQEALRVCKPGSFMLCFGGTRTFHRLACEIEDAGWEIRDCLMWLYGSGFPKSHNNFGIEGYGTALKPAYEIIMAFQKSLSTNTEQNIIVENLIKLWCQLCLMLPVNVAEKIFESNNLDMNEALNFAQWNVEKKSNIQGDLYALMDILQLEKALISCLSTVSLWKITLEDHWKSGNTYTTSMKTNPIIDLKTLSFFLCQLTPQNIIQEESKQHGSWLNVLHAARYLNAVVKNINAIHELFVLENAIEKAGINVQTLGLSPNYEPIIMCMKPIDGTFAQNAEKWGQSGINIDSCRIGIGGTKRSHQSEYPKNEDGTEDRSQHWARTGHTIEQINLGRWPANIILEEEVGKIVDEQSGIYASRFFYCAKASPSERNKGCQNLQAIEKSNGNKWTDQDYRVSRGERPESAQSGPRKNHHPTVKPLKLLTYLLTLISPPKDAIILDPFAGSGSTLVAAKSLCIDCVGIEINEEYVKIAKSRLDESN